MPIDYEKRQHVAYLTINNPRKANILDRDISQQLSDAWTEVWQDRDVRAAVITGAGDRHFCAGHNLEALADLTPEDRERYTIERLVWPAAGTVNGSRTGADGTDGRPLPTDMETRRGRRQRMGRRRRVSTYCCRRPTSG